MGHFCSKQHNNKITDNIIITSETADNNTITNEDNTFFVGEYIKFYNDEKTYKIINFITPIYFEFECLDYDTNFDIKSGRISSINKIETRVCYNDTNNKYKKYRTFSNDSINENYEESIIITGSS